MDYSPIGTTQAGYSSIEYLHQRNLKSQTKGHYSEKIHIFDTQTNKKFNLISKLKENTIRHKDNSFEEYPEKSRFYSSYIGNVKTLTDNNKIAKEKKEDYQKILHEKIQEMFKKIQNGETEPSYQIGALSFTEKEWDIFLEKFDSLQDAIKKLVKAEQEKKEQLEEIIAEKDSNVLVSEFITYTCPSKNPNDKNTLYIT